MIDLELALRELHRGGVEFIIIGGVAATIHGSARVTQDLDIVYARTPENIARLAATLSEHRPYLRGAPAGLPVSLGRRDDSPRPQLHVDHVRRRH